MDFLKYFSLGGAVFGSVESVIALAKAPVPLDGPTLLSVVQPALSAVTSVFPKAKVPADLAAQICNGLAAIVNKYYKKGA